MISNAGQVGFRTGGTQTKRDTGRRVQDMRDAEQERCWTMDMRDTGKVECRTGGMQDWRDAGKEGCKKGGLQESRGAETEG